MSAAVAAAAAAACCSSRNSRSRSSSIHTAQNQQYSIFDQICSHRRRRRLLRPEVVLSTMGCRYESQKRREWMSFMEYMRERRPGLVVSGCSGGDVVEFLKHYYLDDQNKNKVPQQQLYWGSVEALIGRLRAAFEEIIGGQALAHTTTINNPFGAPEVRLYLRQLKEAHARHHHHHHHEQLQYISIS